MPPPFDFFRKPPDDTLLDPNIREIRDKLTVLVHYAMLNNERMEMVMALVDDLKAAVAALDTSVEAAIVLIEQLRAGAGAGTVPDAEIAAAIADLQARKAALDAAANPPPAG